MGQLNLFHNTVGISGSDLRQKLNKCRGQQSIVRQYLESMENEFTRSEISYNLNNLGIFIRPESVGRCLSNLLSEGVVIKSKFTKITRYGLGEPEHSYKIK